MTYRLPLDSGIVEITDTLSIIIITRIIELNNVDLIVSVLLLHRTLRLGRLGSTYSNKN